VPGTLFFRRHLAGIGRLAVPAESEAEEPDISLLVDEPSIPPEATAGFP